MQDGHSITLTHEKSDGQYDANGNWFVTLGRLEDSDISLGQDNLASRYHARIYWRSNRWWLEDCNSRNGTYIEEGDGDETRLAGSVPIPIQPGLLFRAGRTWLRIESSEE